MPNFYYLDTPSPVPGSTPLEFNPLYSAPGTVQPPGYPRTAAEIAAGVTPVDYSYEPGDVRRYGADITGSNDSGTAIQNAISQCAQAGGSAVRLIGTLKFAATLTYSTGVTIFGENRQTQLNYTGSGAAIQSATPSTRTYSLTLRDFTLTDINSGTIGLDLSSTSSVYAENVTVSGFTDGIKVYSATNGYAVYGRFVNVSALYCTTGWKIGPTGSNATVLIGCRGSGCETGISITDSNEVKILNCQVEANTVNGVTITEGGSYLNTQYVTISHTRFENSGMSGDAIVVGSGVIRAELICNEFFTSADTISDSGTNTTIINTSPFYPQKGDKRTSPVSGTNSPAFKFIRESSGGDGSYGAFEIEEENTSTGDPISLKVNGARVGTETTSRLLDLRLADAKKFGITPNGKICTNQTVADASAPPANVVAKMPIYDEAGALVGYIPIYATI